MGMYKLNICTICDENGNDINSYGISFKNKKINDVSTDKNKVLKLIEKCNKLKVSEIHIYDIIEDFFVDFEI